MTRHSLVAKGWLRLVPIMAYPTPSLDELAGWGTVPESVQLYSRGDTSFALMTVTPAGNNVDAGSIRPDISGRSETSTKRREPRKFKKAEEIENEYLDNFVRNSADRLDYRLLGVSRRRRANPPAAGIRGDFPDLAFCDGKIRRLIAFPDRGSYVPNTTEVIRKGQQGCWPSVFPARS